MDKAIASIWSNMPQKVDIPNTAVQVGDLNWCYNQGVNAYHETNY